MVNIKIHRGTSQIGGTITEIYTENTHIFIDFGSELTVNPEDSTDGKMIDMIKCAECDAVLFSHYHGDHIGLLENIPQKDIRGEEITLGIGKVARQVLVNIQKTLANDATSEPKERQVHKDMLNLLQDNSRWLDFMDALTEGNEQSSNFDIGDFHITTIRVDHSAYDSYMFVIEAEGKCIVHTGDFRVHGRLGEHFFDKFNNFMQHKKVDVLLIEGTMLGRLDEKVMTEKELQKEATRLLQQPENKYVYLICSSTNMESLASFHKAVLFSNKEKEKAGNKDCKRAMYVNHYVKQQMDLFASAEPDITWGFRKANPFEQQGKYNEALGMSQMEYMEKNGFLTLIGKSEGYKKYIEPFKEKNPLLIYSMWDGYVEDKEADTYDEKWGAVYNSFERKIKLHTSGHAVKKDLEEMIAIVSPSQAIIPIHTEFKESYEKLEGVGNKVKALVDGDVITLAKTYVSGKDNEIMSKWDKYICELLEEIKKNDKAVAVGITGSYIRRNNKDKSLRIYMNGGRILRIPLSEGDFEFGDDYLEEKHLYLEKEEQDAVRKIVDAVLKNPYVWKDNNYKLLHEYLVFMEKATLKRYGSLKHSGVSKERMYQMNLFKKLVEDDSKEYTFVDVEFQTIAEMNYSIEEIEDWKKEHKNTKGMHCGRPDYIAIQEGGFLIIELKSNKGSLGGSAGIEEHRNDFEVLMKMNRNNHIMATELKARLQTIYDYGVIKDSCRTLAQRILNMEVSDLTIDERYLFITNAALTKDMCEVYIEEKGIDKSKVIFEEE